MLNKYLITIFIGSIIMAPTGVLALSMPTSGNELAEISGISAQAYIVQDVKTGDILIGKNVNEQRIPASLTKLVTALVVLDTNPKLTKTVAITQADQDLGACGLGGACIKAKPGVKFTVDALFHAALIPSANNAANALARSTGLSPEDFALKMNQKMQSLGATDSNFVEPTGMSVENKITAQDYVKVVSAAFANSYLRKISALSKYALRCSNNSRYNQTIKNTDKLLSDGAIEVLGAKTGYLNESRYNFASLVNYSQGQELAIVVLGEEHLYTAFYETKQLVSMAETAKLLTLMNFSPAVLGTSSNLTVVNN